MVAISKELFYKSSPEITCHKLLHPSQTSCLKGILNMILHTAVGSSKFFFLIYLLQTIIKWKKVNKKFIDKQIRSYIRSIAYALCYVTNFFCLACLSRRWTNQFYFYNIALYSGFGGLAIFIESEENRSINTAIFLNLVTEVIIRYLYVRRTILKETVLFMSCSALLMYLLKTQKTDKKIFNLWKVFLYVIYCINVEMFYNPPQLQPKQPKDKNRNCTHKKSCYDYCSAGFATYFVAGYILQMLKHLVPRLSAIIVDPIKLWKAVFRKDSFWFGLLFGNYVATYRIVACLLQRKDKGEKPVHFLLAGFLAGSAYFLKPTLPLVAIAFTTSIQLILQRSLYLNKVQSTLPTREIAFALCSAFLLHNRFFLPESCPKYVKTMLNAITNGQINKIYENALELVHPALIKSVHSC